VGECLSDGKFFEIESRHADDRCDLR